MEKIDYIKIIGIIGSVVAFINTFFSKEQSKNNKLSEDYFEKLLVPYINKYKMNPNLNTVKFIKKNYSMDKYYIPSYIFLLVDNDNKELLHKVLIVDYRNNIPGQVNNINKTINNLSKIGLMIVVYMYYFFSIILSMVILYQAINIILDFISRLKAKTNGINASGYISIGIFEFSDAWFSIITLIISFIMLIIVQYMPRIMLYITTDDYALKNKQIGKVLKRKERDYKKSSDYYIH